MTLPFSEAAERNKEPILKVLKQVLQPWNKKVLEIGAGTGQHATFFASHFPHLTWTPTEQAENLPVLNQAVQLSGVENLTPPFKIKVGEDEPPIKTYDVVYTANTFHIMSWKECKTLIKMLSGILPEKGLVIIYGPFNYEGGYTSKSNEEFDQCLKQNIPGGGLRAFEDVQKSFEKNDFEFVQDFEMPAHNRTLVFRRLRHKSKFF